LQATQYLDVDILGPFRTEWETNVGFMYSLALAKRQKDDDQKCSEATRQADKLYTDEFDLQGAETDASALEAAHRCARDMALQRFEQVRSASKPGPVHLCALAHSHVCVHTSSGAMHLVLQIWLSVGCSHSMHPTLSIAHAAQVR
jgi:hypothetical protein